MPPVIVAVAAAAASAIVASSPVIIGVLGAVGASLLGAAAAAAVSFVGSAIIGKPKNEAPSFAQEARDRLVNVRQPITYQRLIYGQVKVGGPIVFLATSPGPDGKANDYLHIIIALAGHPCEAIMDVYFDDVLATDPRFTPSISAQPFDASRYYSPGEVVSYNGRAWKRTDAAQNQEGLWAPSNFDGQAPEFIPPDPPAVPGQALEFWTPVEDLALIRKYLGDAGQQADPTLVAANVGWTTAHRLQGICYLYVRLKWDPNVWVSGIPKITAVVRGKKDIWDPRLGARSWTFNAALCMANYLEDAKFGLGVNFTNEIDEATLIAAANVCDEVVPTFTGGVENRYICSGTIDANTARRDAIEQLRSAMGGAVVFSGGKWRIYAAAWRAPTSAALDEGDLRGPIRVQTKLSRRDGFNGVKGVFISAAHNWQPTDYPAVTNATYLAEDNGERVWAERNLPFTPTPSMAQRLAKIELERARRQLVVSAPFKLTAFRAAVAETVRLTNARWGWTDKTFEVTGWRLAIEQDDNGMPYLGVDLTLREIDANVYVWSADEEKPLPAAPTTNLPDIRTVQPPGVPSVREEMYATRDGAGVRVKAVVSWGRSPHAFEVQYQLEYRPAFRTDWTVLPRTDGIFAEVFDLVTGGYEFRVKAVSSFNVSSPYVYVRKEIVGLAAPPTPVTGLTVSIISSLALLQFDRHPDLDVRIGGYIRVRHSPALTGATWDQAYDLHKVDGAQTIAIVPAISGTYLLKAFDSGGRQSAVATVSTNAASLLTFSSLATVVEDPAFGGTKTGVVVDTGRLKLSGGGDFDAIPNFDTVSNLDSDGGILSAGTYLFASGTDLGLVKAVRVSATVGAAVVNERDQIDNRGALVDDWEDWDGAVAASAGVAVYIRQTDDDPSGSPTWGPWQRLTVGDYRARAFQYKAELTSEDPAYNVLIDQLEVEVKEAA